MEIEPVFVSVREAAKLLGMGVSTLHGHLKRDPELAAAIVVPTGIRRTSIDVAALRANRHRFRMRDTSSEPAQLRAARERSAAQ